MVSLSGRTLRRRGAYPLRYSWIGRHESSPHAYRTVDAHPHICQNLRLGEVILAKSGVLRTVMVASAGRKASLSFANLKAASGNASSAARGSSLKHGTRCELALRSALWRLGLRYRVNVRSLPGCPDVVFSRQKVAIFCDGDFWHGRALGRRLKKLAAGHNAQYWTAKVQRNVDRDRKQSAELRRAGWLVLRYWETDILSDPKNVASAAAQVIKARRPIK